MNERRPALSSILLGALLPGIVVGIAAAAPLVNDPFITPVDGRILTLGWWLMVPLGTAFAILRSRRVWPGVVIGAWSIAAFHVSMVLVSPVTDRIGMLWSFQGWVAALFGVAVPWAIGMVLGWQSIERQTLRHDGSTTPGAI
jgi:hypothetical protein